MHMQVDTNHNGFIDSREMEIILNKLRDDGQRASKLEVKSVMDFVDANGDRLVGFDEFIRVRNTCRRALFLVKQPLSARSWII